MKKFLHFIQYNNLVTLGIFFIFGSTGLAFAFDEDVQQAVYSTEQEVQSVDNSYIVDVDLGKHDFNLKILEIKEDADNYYVKYSYNTITLLDYVWQDELITENIVTSKQSMIGKDLGLFIARQVGEVIASKLEYLKKVQAIEKQNGVSTKKVATKYKGLVGKMFDPTEEVFEGYKPVVKEAVLPTNQVAKLSEPFVSQIALPHVPSEAEIQDMVNDAYNAMLLGLTDPVVTATTTDEIADDTTDDVVDETDGDDTATTTDGGGGTIDPVPDPEPTPDPIPDPEPTPEPTPDPVPDPEPTPEPTPDPVPDPEPVVEQTPEPEPTPDHLPNTVEEVVP